MRPKPHGRRLGSSFSSQGCSHPYDITFPSCVLFSRKYIYHFKQRLTLEKVIQQYYQLLKWPAIRISTQQRLEACTCLTELPGMDELLFKTHGD